MATRFIDFDAVVAERDAARTPVRVRYAGKEWDLYPSMPAIITMRIVRWTAEGRSGDTITRGELLELAADLVPPDVLDGWHEEGIDNEDLGDLLRRVFQAYTTEDGGGLGEAQAPEGADPSPTSSTTGPSSRLTSLASTT